MVGLTSFPLQKKLKLELPNSSFHLKKCHKMAMFDTANIQGQNFQESYCNNTQLINLFETKMTFPKNQIKPNQNNGIET